MIVPLRWRSYIRENNVQFSLKRTALLVGVLLSLSACDTLREIQPDPALSSVPVEAPAVLADSDWPEAGRNPTHSGGNLALGAALSQSWSTSIGEGSSSGVKLLAQPIAVHGVIYTLDTEALLTAVDAKTGDRKWDMTISPEDAREETLGGGIGSGDGRLYVSAGYPEVLALDPANGKVLWRRSTEAPTRGAPVYADGRVFVLTIENQFLVLNAKTGEIMWTHSGVNENEAYLSDAGPAADDTIAVVPYSSGEIYALRLETGTPAWSDNLSAVRRASALWSLTDFNGLPVIDKGRVYAISVSGRIIAIDERTGARLWQHEIGSSATPWIAGKFLYVLSSDNQLIAMDAEKGGIRWVTQLDRYEDPEKHRYPIFWTGPVMAGGRLILANSIGQLVEVSIADGKEIKRTELPDPVFVQPIVVGGMLYLVTDEGDLVAYR
jgi:outer membrane protein assembly factor BamB